ncbi:hypothetical protein SHIRM173S_08572 [Streptomyces hirsutus]
MFVLTGLDIEAKADLVKEQMTGALAKSPPAEVRWELARTDRPDAGTEETASALLRLVVRDPGQEAVRLAGRHRAGAGQLPRIPCGGATGEGRPLRGSCVRPHGPSTMCRPPRGRRIPVIAHPAPTSTSSNRSTPACHRPARLCRCGILANAQGVLFSEESQKAAQFIQLANQRDIPLLFLHNTTGYMVGKEYEQGGIIKHGAMMINAVGNSKVPHLSVLLGASYGAGHYGMCGRAYDPRFLFAWPGAKSAVMGPQQLAGVLSIVARQSAAAKGRPYDDEADAALRAMVEQQIESESLPLFLSGRLYDDGVIDPRDTRTVLGLCAVGRPHGALRGRARWLRRLPDVRGHGDQYCDSSSPTGARIACRIARTCGELGIRTVTVHSDVVRHALGPRAGTRLPPESRRGGALRPRPRRGHGFRPRFRREHSFHPT